VAFFVVPVSPQSRTSVRFTRGPGAPAELGQSKASQFYDMAQVVWGSAFRSADWLASSLGNRPLLHSLHASLLTSFDQRLDTPSAPRWGAF